METENTRAEYDTHTTRLDGNAAAGLLRTLFAHEMTTAVSTCGTCGATGPVGELHAYIHGMGTTLRCAGCNTILIRIGHGRGQYWLDLSGLRVLQIAVPDE